MSKGSWSSTTSCGATDSFWVKEDQFPSGLWFLSNYQAASSQISGLQKRACEGGKINAGRDSEEVEGKGIR